jgi:NADH-quinone oxidoreductase subunit M
MSDSIMLLLLLIIPCAGALLVSLIPGGGISRLVTMLVMLLQLALSAALFLGYTPSVSGSADCFLPLIPTLGVNLHFGLDGLNIYLLLLSTLLFPVVVACSWNTEHLQSRLYLALLLILEAFLLGTFLSQNLMLFFIFWEAVLLPMFILILTFGGEQRRRAAMAFFLYTLLGSVLLLAAVILLGVAAQQQTGSWSYEFETLYRLQLDWNTQLFVFVAIVLACAIKCPIFPFHSWLPLAYCEAPASATALMSGVLSKMGAFGLLKLALPLCPLASAALAPWISLLAVISILYGAVLALRQEDFKRLVAYSSLSHMGYIVLGIFSLQQSAIHGALFQILSHGVAVAGLFLFFDLLDQRTGPAWRSLNALSTSVPRLAVLAMLLILTSLALPLTSGFTAEFLILFGAFQQGMAGLTAGTGALQLTAALLACSGMVLGAAYMLRFARSILFGTRQDALQFGDLNLREALAFAPLLLIIILIGVWPVGLMDKTRPAVEWIAGRAAAPAVAQPRAVAAVTTPPGGVNGH